MATVEAVVEAAAETIAAAGCDEPRADAEALVANALGSASRISRTARVRRRPRSRRRSRPAPSAAPSTSRSPTSSATRCFREIDVAVDPRVLIPRRETGLLVEAAKELPEGARVHEVGTGSGADRPGPAQRAARPQGHRLRPLAGGGRSRARERRAARPRPRGQRRGGPPRRAPRGGRRHGHRQSPLRHRLDDLRALARDPARAADRRHRRLRRGWARRDPRRPRRDRRPAGGSPSSTTPTTGRRSARCCDDATTMTDYMGGERVTVGVKP